MSQFFSIVAAWVLLDALYYFCRPGWSGTSGMDDSYYLDPDSVGWPDDEKSYETASDLRDDLVDLPIYYDWVVDRGRVGVLWASDIAKRHIGWIDVIVLAAASRLAFYRAMGYLDHVIGSAWDD